MDRDEQTAWEDINPTTALVRQPEQRSASLDRLRPATNIEFRNELTACLVLVAPAGMTEEARGEWLRVAWETLKHLPADLLSMGCRKARETADHPSKIVPIILAETAELMRLRREAGRDAAHIPPSHQLAPADVCTPEQAAEIMKEFGLTRNPLS